MQREYTKDPSESGLSALHGLLHQPPYRKPPKASGHKLPLEEIRINNRKQKGGRLTNAPSVCSYTTIHSRFTPGNLWPCHPALEIYLLPVTHWHFLLCLRLYAQGLLLCLLQRCKNIPSPGTSTHPHCCGILRDRVPASGIWSARRGGGNGPRELRDPTET